VEVITTDEDSASECDNVLFKDYSSLNFKTQLEKQVLVTNITERTLKLHWKMFDEVLVLDHGQQLEGLEAEGTQVTRLDCKSSEVEQLVEQLTQRLLPRCNYMQLGRDPQE